MQSNNVLNQAKEDATGTAQKTVSLTGLRQFEVPFMSKEEQEQIVEELDSTLSIVSNLNEKLTTHLQKAESLRQSILKKAFEGKLIS